MSLHGSIAKLQSGGARLYLAIAQCFEENNLIRDIWLDMARGKEQQTASLDSLPPSFWRKLGEQEEALTEAIKSCLPLAGCSSPDAEDHGLKKCLTKTLDFEEPGILKVYAPLIRQLRTEWTDRALDLYIMIKAHVAKLLRVIQSFSGDPALLQRAGALLREFEKEVQVSDPSVIVAGASPRHKVAAQRHAKETVKDSRRVAKAKPPSRSRSLIKRAKSISPRAKPLMKNVEVRRRARA